MSFFRKQQQRLAERLLVWQYQRQKLAAPPPHQLAEQARDLVDEAHRIARQRGRNVVSILKELVADLKR
jgi:hypothetical protein